MAPLALVTGSTGFVGRALVRILLNAGWTVRALVLPRDPVSLPASVERTSGDVCNPDSLRGTAKDVDALFHLAAHVSSWERDPAIYASVNVGGTRNIVNEAVRSNVPRFLFTSSISAIGVTPGQMVRENSPPGRVFGAYERSKADAQRVVDQSVREQGLQAVSLIPGIVIGPGDAVNTGKILLAFVRGEFPATFAEESFLPVVSVEDVARAHLLAYERGRVGEKYIISGQNVKWGELLRIASAASGTPVPSRHVGALAVRLAARASEIRARATRSAPRFPAWLASFMLTGAAMDNARSIGELGMEYTPISRAIGETVKWFGEEGLFSPSGVPPRTEAVSFEALRESGGDVLEDHDSTDSPDAQPVDGRRPKPPPSDR